MGAFYIYTDVQALPVAVNTAGALTVSGPESVFCIYDSDFGNLVTLPASNQSYFSPESETNLMGIALPGSDDPLPELALPGCRVDAPGDCIIARAVNGMPAECAANPSKRLCVLHLVVAFCFDIPMRSAGQDAGAEVEACFRRVALGPCVANPGGAACISGQFAGIAKFGTGGGGSPGRRMLRRSDPGPLFGDQPSLLPAEDQFWVGEWPNPPI